ncbi:nuclease-related domain-containing protein [Streptomyces olivoreticuli]
MDLPDGTAVAWADRRSGEVTVLLAEFRDAALEVLAPYLAETSERISREGGRLSLPSLAPDDDLAKNRPGAELRTKLTAEGPSALERMISWMLRRESEWDSWRAGLVGERVMGAELERLSRHGWRVLHSVPLPNSVDIDHLLIGPGGVFNINTKHHPKMNVWVGDDSVKINHGPPRPYTRKVRAEARRVRRVLEKYSGTTVQVNPILAFVGIAGLTTVATLQDVRAWRDRDVAALGPVTGALQPAQIETLYEIARHRRAWEDA